MLRALPRAAWLSARAIFLPEGGHFGYVLGSSALSEVGSFLEKTMETSEAD